MSQFHYFHIVTPSPWPLLTAFRVFRFLRSVVFVLWKESSTLVYFRVVRLIICCVLWWRDVCREARLEGCHSEKVSYGIRRGIILFIVREVLLFFSLFWGFFHSSLRVLLETGLCWPYVRVCTPIPFEVPLLNTLILLRRGVTVTWAHHRLLRSDPKGYYLGILITLILGFYFTLVQAWEYLEARIGFNDGGLGSCFYLATGVHGCHVLVGRVFLAVMLYRGIKGEFRVRHHFGFEARAWYWHFVDVVWIGLFVMVYWWGGAYDHGLAEKIYMECKSSI